MFIYGKTSSNAIAVLSYLALDPARQAGSGEIAMARKISKALTAKLLTQLAAAGLVRGRPGPGGGYRLGKPAKTICLLDVVSLFEQVETPSLCPFGHGWCGNGDPCPLHPQLESLLKANHAFLKKTTLDLFVGKTPRMATKRTNQKWTGLFAPKT